MDVDRTLEMIRSMIALYEAESDSFDGEILAENVAALDEWITRHGFLPADWTRDGATVNR